jgi:hypothetical protein
LKEYGNAWIMIASDPVSKVVMTYVVGKRNQKEIDLLILTVEERTDSNIPHFLIYTRVVKTRVGRRVVGVDTEVVFGEKDAAQ